MSWTVQRSQNFDKWCKKEDYDEANWEPHAKALGEFQNVSLPHNRQSKIFSNDSYQCWVTRLPDKARQKGKSGGFRVVLVLDLEDKILITQGLFRRDHLSYDGSSGKYDDAFNTLLSDLASEYIPRL